MEAEIWDGADQPEEFVRFGLSERVEHLALMIAFAGLVLTGLPQKFFGAGWAQSTILAIGGIEVARLVHRAFAIGFCLVGVHHAMAIGLAIRGRRFVPSMVPGLRDVSDAINYFRYCMGLATKKPLFGRFDYWQKFQYWSVVAGWCVMVATGLSMVFPTHATRLLPGAFVPAAREMHGGEALLVLLVVVTWHLYGVHLNPLRFPGDLSIFTGKISRRRMIEEHPLEYMRVTGVGLPPGAAPGPLGQEGPIKLKY